MCWLKRKQDVCFYCKDKIIYEDKEDNYKIQCTNCNIIIHNACYEKYENGSLLCTICPNCKKIGTICSEL